ncbi:hypothetical protein HMPREF9519_01900 [Enterococcus faecalis TX1346]|nr:hypothetical protein HMPREF9519_01900 [Enterococcus faecalis TX1346]
MYGSLLFCRTLCFIYDTVHRFLLFCAFVKKGLKRPFLPIIQLVFFVLMFF